MEQQNPRVTDEAWRARAASYGVDPDEPDDHKFFAALGRAENIVDSFKYHQPSAEQIGRIANVRAAHIDCAKLILQNVASSADQTVAIRKLHESMMTCNKSIVCEKT